jgi:hypothetical protein
MYWIQLTNVFVFLYVTIIIIVKNWSTYENGTFYQKNIKIFYCCLLQLFENEKKNHTGNMFNESQKKIIFFCSKQVILQI